MHTYRTSTLCATYKSGWLNFSLLLILIWISVSNPVFEPSMIFSNLIFYFASFLLVTTYAIPSKRILTTVSPNGVNSSTLSPPRMSTVLQANNLAANPTWHHPRCWSDHPIAGSMEKPSPITDRGDCLQAVYNMLYEGPDEELLIWEEPREWKYESCGLFLVASPRLPIHRATFTRVDLARCADIIWIACVTREHGYRGGSLPIGAGVFQVVISGDSDPPPLEYSKASTISNTTGQVG